MTTIINISGYKFIPLDNLEKLQQSLKQHCQAIKLKGTILLSTEGININLAGEREQIDKFKNYMLNKPVFSDMVFKESMSATAPFSRMFVKIKREIITFGRPGVNSQENSQFNIAPKQLKEWLDSGKKFTMIDTRNDYETQIGTFTPAITLDIDHFTQFPAAINDLPQLSKQEPIVVFCTGGVRCEKVVPLMREQGFNEVYQLEGGILNYFAECGGEHYTGECFVFDDRIGLNPQLEPTGTVLCKACQYPVTKDKQQMNNYKPGISCSHCG
jgi:UPF0176 protein